MEAKAQRWGPVAQGAGRGGGGKVGLEEGVEPDALGRQRSPSKRCLKHPKSDYSYWS